MPGSRMIERRGRFGRQAICVHSFRLRKSQWLRNGLKDGRDLHVRDVNADIVLFGCHVYLLCVQHELIQATMMSCHDTDYG